MEIKKIVFLEPINPHLHIYSKFNLPRIGSTLLATIMKQAGYEVRAYFLTTEAILQRNITADIVCISTITSTAQSAYLLADYYRSKQILVIMGGPHISALPMEAMSHADYVIVGEGEKTLPKLISTLQSKNSDFSSISGLYWRNGESAIMHNPIESHLTDLDQYPLPDYSLLEMATEHLGAKGEKPTIPVQTSRGCPFDCSFCSVTSMFGKKFRYRSTNHIIRELEQYDPKKHAIFFYDDNFTANRKRTKELLEEMIKRKLIFRWSTQVRVDIAKDPELLDLMKKAGCNTLYIGFESVDPQALLEMHKNQTIEDIKFAISEIRKRNINIHGMFIFGFDADRPQTVRSTVKFAIKQKIDTAQFLILTPFPGTPFYQKIIESNRIIDTNWDEYDAHHVKFMPKHFSPLELQMAQVNAHTKFYRMRRIFLRLLRGRVQAFVIGLYANFLNRQWVKHQGLYLQRIRQIVKAKA